MADGFLGPVFFVWLGASLDLKELIDHPGMIALAGAQLGVPVAAVTIGQRAGLLRPGEGAAILAAALVGLAVTAWAADRAERDASPPATAPPPAPAPSGQPASGSSPSRTC